MNLGSPAPGRWIQPITCRDGMVHPCRLIPATTASPPPNLEAVQQQDREGFPVGRSEGLLAPGQSRHPAPLAAASPGFPRLLAFRLPRGKRLRLGQRIRCPKQGLQPLMLGATSCRICCECSGGEQGMVLPEPFLAMTHAVV